MPAALLTDSQLAYPLPNLAPFTTAYTRLLDNGAGSACVYGQHTATGNGPALHLPAARCVLDGLVVAVPLVHAWRTHLTRHPSANATDAR